MERGSKINTIFSWWYGLAFQNLASNLRGIYLYLFDAFSVKICLSTLFSVWRRDMISYQNLSLQEVLQAWMLNLSSRIIGFLVKVATLISFAAMTLAFSFVSVILIFCWFLMPLLIPAIFVIGIKIAIGV